MEKDARIVKFAFMFIKLFCFEICESELLVVHLIDYRKRKNNLKLVWLLLKVKRHKSLFLRKTNIISLICEI